MTTANCASFGRRWPRTGFGAPAAVVLLVFLLTHAAHRLGAATVSVTRGPYLQRGTTTSVGVRWRTDVTTDSFVRYGVSPGNFTGLASVASVVNNHSVTVAGLQSGTKYYYQIGSSSEGFAAGTNQFFVTAPPVGTPKPTRIWVLGDSGQPGANAAAVRDAYAAHTGARPTDVWLMLGDNAYESGTDAEYQKAVFNVYQKFLPNAVLWPTIGNHDRDSAYFSIFSLPKKAQAGGVASGTERYYSFDYANIHFICLDAQSSDRSSDGPMCGWLRADLEATAQEWLIAFWHHPPYTKGSHNSDADVNSVEMRKNVVPILESHGVDLVLCGHSHSYERSFLLDGHYTASGDFTPSMRKDAGDGREQGDGAYRKTLGAPGHQGAVYAVAGSSSRLGGGSLDHPAMFRSLNRLGSVVIDVQGDRLDLVFLQTNGAAGDACTIIKGPPVLTVLIAPNSVWKYLDNGSDPGTAWRTLEFDDAAWASGPAPLGYDAREATTVSYGAGADFKHVTTYFRREFTVADPSAFTALNLLLLRDDGGVVYLNGQEVFRSNMPTGAVTYLTFAPTGAGNPDEDTFFPAPPIASALLVPGENVVAAEIHQRSRTSPDMAFNLALTAATRTVPLRLKIVVGPGGTVSLGWNAIPGKPYRVQCAASQPANVWTTLGNDVIATTSSVVVTDAPGAHQQRFYRVLLLD